jgi:hypothetical protein
MSTARRMIPSLCVRVVFGCVVIVDDTFVENTCKMQADARIRTADPFITSEVLYQLSYVGEAPRLASLDRTGTFLAVVCQARVSS